MRVTPGSDASAVSIRSASNSGEVRPEAASTFSHSCPAARSPEHDIRGGIEPGEIGLGDAAEGDAPFGMVDAVNRQKPLGLGRQSHGHAQDTEAEGRALHHVPHT